MTTVKKKLTHPLLLPYFQQKLDLKFDLLILRMPPLVALQVAGLSDAWAFGQPPGLSYLAAPGKLTAPALHHRIPRPKLPEAALHPLGDLHSAQGTSAHAPSSRPAPARLSMEKLPQAKPVRRDPRSFQRDGGDPRVPALPRMPPRPRD